MMNRFNLELSVGVFVLLGFMAMAYISIQLGQLPLGGGGTYKVTAMFSTAGGLQRGADIEIAGVKVGRVEKIALEDYEALVTMSINSAIELQEDVIASIKTRGLIGEKYVRITPGGSDRLIAANGRIREVETPLDFEDVIGQFIQGKI
jgi:phospholipid/cholesterol/gamma-HCH transport system substrate-binding protein